MNESPNPVHMATSPDTRWTTVNFAEAIQGVQTPLGWGFWSLAMETSVRQAFANLGALANRDAPPPEDANKRISGIFYGRVAGNINTFRTVGDNMPGSSGDMIEEKLFGVVPTGKSGKSFASYRRYPVVAGKLPLAAMKPGKTLPRMRAEYRDWWQRETLDHPPTTYADAQTLMADSAQHFIDVGVHHTVTSMLGSALLDALGDLADKAVGDPSLAMTLATGYGGMEETSLLADLLAAARDELEVDAVVRKHGYHGFDEGNLASRSWREDRAGLESFIRGYKRPGVVGPAEREKIQTERRLAAEKRLLEGLPATRRAGAKLTLKLASKFIPIREIGKAAFLHAVDGGRCAARAGGRALVEEGVLSDVEDVFFLTYDEFVGGVDKGRAAEIVAERKANHERYQALELPPSWAGEPAPTEVRTDAPSTNGTPREAVTEIKGIGVVGDTVTGRARVVTDPLDAELDDGDILVCATTDPSWTPLFMLVDALVIDMGGAMSHGAIVARELGVTCVINTVSGTKDIPDGAQITVNGSTGVVTIDS
jgi:pyruvate,water dikinase